MPFLEDDFSFPPTQEILKIYSTVLYDVFYKFRKKSCHEKNTISLVKNPMVYINKLVKN